MISFRNLQEYQVAAKVYKVQTSFPEILLAKTAILICQAHYLAKYL